MKKIMSFFVALVIVFALVGQVSANSDVDIAKKNVIHLKADKNSDIILDNVEVYNTTVDDEYHIRIEGTRAANGELEEYDLHIDYDKKTYKADKTENNEYNDDYRKIEEVKSEFAPFAITNYIAKVTASTMDPAFVKLTETTLSLGWKDNNGVLSHNSRSLSTWAANPSSLGTNWYLESTHYSNDPFHFQSATATYKNSDFLGGLPGPTKAATYIYI